MPQQRKFALNRVMGAVVEWSKKAQIIGPNLGLDFRRLIILYITAKYIVKSMEKYSILLMGNFSVHNSIFQNVSQ